MGSPIPNIPLTGTLLYMGLVPKPIPSLGNVQREKKQDAKCSADTQEPKNQLHFMPKYSNPCLDYPELPLPSAASSPPAPNPTKQSQTKFLIFLILGWAEGDLSSLQFSSWESSSATPQPPSTSLPRPRSAKAFWEKYPKPTFQSRGGKKAA